LLLDLEHPDQPLKLGPHNRASYVALDPSGKWAATGAWGGTGVKVWDAHTGQLLRDLPVDGAASVAFTPDGQWLATANVSEWRLWKTGSWAPAQRSLPNDGVRAVGVSSFSPDGRLMAAVKSHEIEIVKIPGFEKVVSLKTPAIGTINSICFSPDGGQLAALEQNQHIHLWDLRRIRAQLQKMDLDWDLPPFAPESQRPGADAVPLRLATSNL
jgi:WD40 repeat protein